MARTHMRRGETKSCPQSSVSRWNAFSKDLSLFCSLWIARLMVRAVIRRERNDRALRLELIKLVPAQAKTGTSVRVT